MLELYSEIDYIKGEVAFNKEFTPDVVDKLDFQDRNYRGLFWWYNKIHE